MSIVVTGSIAFDYLMSFPGKFTEHFLPEHMQRVSLSFLVDSMDKRRGGCAPNIAYTLALLGERPRLMATAGQDFDDYRRWLEAAGVDTSLVQGGRREVHGVVLLQHRRGEQPDRVVLHRAPWPTRASCRSAP
jgi:sugar/nucleoside kinase (ribokinase family)